MVFGKEEANSFDITYIVHGKEKKEADVVRCRNGAAVNYTEDYMRRRDPECMVIADKKPTNKQKFEETYGYDFSGLRKETLLWLKERELIVVPFRAGGKKYGYPAILICFGKFTGICEYRRRSDSFCTSCHYLCSTTFPPYPF